MKNKIKKIIPYLFILIALVGILGYGGRINAQEKQEPNGSLQDQLNQCQGGLWGKTTDDIVTCFNYVEKKLCKIGDGPSGYANCINLVDQYRNTAIEKGLTANDASATGANSGAQTSTGQNLGDKILGGCSKISNADFGACTLKLMYIILISIPSGLLWLSAYIFNILIFLVIQSGIYTHGFIGSAWEVVRDLSNIFFILILLYVAIKTVLNMGGHETKSMITSVIIMAILINFSLFFTKIVIDSSNILALVFYNKLDVTYEKNGVAADRPYDSVKGERDVAGTLYKKFNVTNLINESVLNGLTRTKIKYEAGAGSSTGTPQGVVVVGNGPLPVGATIVIMLIAGIIMIVAAYTFFTSGIFFIGRIIELWLLMIFAPFAFMSFAVPKLSHTEYGWGNWVEKLISTAFMAPIFMFFMYLIFRLIGAGSNVLNEFTAPNSGVVADILSILIPALIILGMLLKAKDLAKKGGGQFGEMAMGMAKVVMGVAAGATIGLGAAAGQATLGRLGKKLAEDKTLAEKEAAGSWRAGALRTIGGKAASSSFDLRKGVGGGILKLASTATGLNLGAQSKIMMKEDGGYVGDLKRRNDARLKRAEELKKAASGDATHTLHGLEEAQQELLMNNGTDHEIAKLDAQIKAAEANKLAYKGVSGKEDMYEKYGQEVIRLKDQKRGIKNGLVKDKDGNYVTDNGLMSGKALEKTAEAMEGGVTSSRSAAEEARRIVAAAETSINTAKTNADAAMSAASKAIEEATAVERSLGNSLAPADIAQRETARATVEKTRQEAVNAENAIASAQADFAIAKATEADKESALATATEKYETVKGNIEKLKKEDKEDRARGGKGKIGRSINDYEDDLIPNAKHDVKHAGNVVAWKYAETLEKQWFPPFRKEELHHSAHEIRMGAKPEKGHGGGDHGGVSVIDDIAANLITDSLKGATGGDSHAGDHGAKH